jgi:alpha-glucosidase
MSAEPWWKHAVIYQADPRGFSTSEGSDLHGLTQRLDYIQSLGADAILLTPIQPDATHAQTIDPAFGTLDDLDDLIHQSSRRSIRVLLELDPHIPTTDLSTVARFWLNRGVAGFHLTAASPIQTAELRKATGSYVGQRILIGDIGQATLSPTLAKGAQSHDDPQLLIDPEPGTAKQLTASAIRPALEAAQDLLQSNRGVPLLLTDGPSYQRSISRYADGTHDLAIAKTLAAMLFTTRAAAILYYGQEIGLPTLTDPTTATVMPWDAPPAPPAGTPTPNPDTLLPNVALEDANQQSLLNWYRQLSALHHGNRTISSGANITLNHDDQNILAWVRKPQTVSGISPAIVIICNLSAQPVHLSLKEDMKRLNLKGSFLRTIMRSDNALGPMHLDGMTIAPYTAYIGELRY